MIHLKVIKIIKRNIYNQILESVQTKPVTLITGARQVGKSTIACG